jgi:hypothetical protein
MARVYFKVAHASMPKIRLASLIFVVSSVYNENLRLRNQECHKDKTRFLALAKKQNATKNIVPALQLD